MGTQNIATLSAKAVLDEKGYAAGTKRMIDETTQFERALNTTLSRAKSTFENFLGTIKSGAAFNLSSFAGGALGGFFGTFSTGVVGRMTEAMGEIVARGNEIVMSQRRLREEFNLTRAGAATAVQFGREAGISPDDLRSQFSHAARHIGELRNQLLEGGEGGAAGRALQQMGIDPAAFTSMQLPNALALVGDRMHLISNASERAAAMNALFGRSWHELMPLLERGSAGLESAARRAFTPSALQEMIIRAGRRRQTELSGRAAAGWDQFSTEASSLWNYLFFVGETGLNEFQEQSSQQRSEAANAPIFERLRRLRENSSMVAPADALANAGASGNLSQTLLSLRRTAIGPLLSALGPSGEASMSERISDDINRRIRALQEESATIGMTADEAERYRLALRGATEEELRGLRAAQDLRQNQLNQQDSARERQRQLTQIAQMTEAARSPLEQFQGRVGELRALRDMNPEGFSRAGFNSALGALFRGAGLTSPGGFQQPLLGSLEATGADTLAILQESMSPQVDELVAIQAGLENMQRVLERIAEADESIAEAYDNGEFGPFVP